jgi:hypothetical protein
MPSHTFAIDLLLDGATGDQPVDDHVPILTETINTVDSLVVNRTPGRVHDDDTRRRCEIQSESTHTGGEQEAEILFGGASVEDVDASLSFGATRHRPIDAHEGEAELHHSALDQVQHACALTEDQRAFALLAQPHQQPQQEEHLHRLRFRGGVQFGGLELGQ